MKIGFFGKQNAFALEMLRRLQLEHSHDDFSTWQPGEGAPSTALEVIIAFDRVASAEIEAQATLGLVQMASAGYEGVDVDAATKAGVWVGSPPTTKTGNGESVAEIAVLLMLAASRQLNEELSFTRGTLSICSNTIRRVLSTRHPPSGLPLRRRASAVSSLRISAWRTNPELMIVVTILIFPP